jgi:hypothetical protein
MKMLPMSRMIPVAVDPAMIQPTPNSPKSERINSVTIAVSLLNGGVELVAKGG